MKKIMIIPIFCFLLIFTIYAQNAVELFNRGEEHFQQQKWDDALYYYKKSLQDNPYFTKAMLKIIRVNLEIKNYEEAARYISGLLKVDPKNIEGINYQGELALIQNKNEEAFKIFIRAKKIDPLNYNALHGIATVHIRKKYFSQAEKYLKKLLKIDKKRLDAYLLYAEFYILQNKLNKAKKIIRKGEYFHPDHPDVYFYYGLVYDKKNDKKYAKHYYEKAYYQDKSNSDTILNLLDIYFSLREWENAIKFATNSLKEFPDMPLLYNKLALSYQFSKEIDNALTNFIKAYELNTADDIIQYHLENLLIDKKSCYDKDRKKFANMHFEKAEKFDRNFNKYDALYEYKRGLQIHSEYWEQRFNLATLYKKMGFLEKYLKELEIALMLNPENQKIKDKLEVARTFKSKRLSVQMEIQQYKIKKDQIRIFIPCFNKVKNNFINNQTGKVIAQSINNHLNLHNKFASVKHNHNIDFYFNMNRNEIKKLAKQNNADYYVYGAFKENSDYLSVDFKLYPVKGDEPVKTFFSVSRGKDKLYYLSKDIAKEINDLFEVIGTIIEVKVDNNIIINLGKDDNVEKGDRIEIYDRDGISKDFDLNRYTKKPSKKVATAKIIRADEQIAEAELEMLDYINKISLNDKVILVKKKDERKVK